MISKVSLKSQKNAHGKHQNTLPISLSSPEIQTTIKEEVNRYAKFLGISPKNDPELMWIVTEGYFAKLPKGWKIHENKKGESFYVNTMTGKSSWNHPSDIKYKMLAGEELGKKYDAKKKLKISRRLLIPKKKSRSDLRRKGSMKRKRTGNSLIKTPKRKLKVSKGYKRSPKNLNNSNVLNDEEKFNKITREIRKMEIKKTELEETNDEISKNIDALNSKRLKIQKEVDYLLSKKKALKQEIHNLEKEKFNTSQDNLSISTVSSSVDDISPDEFQDLSFERSTIDFESPNMYQEVSTPKQNKNEEENNEIQTSNTLNESSNEAKDPQNDGCVNRGNIRKQFDPTLREMLIKLNNQKLLINRLLEKDEKGEKKRKAELKIGI